MREIAAGLVVMMVFLSVVVIAAIGVNPRVLATEISCFGGHVEYAVEQPISRIENYRTWADDTHTTIIYDNADCSFKG